MAQFHRRADLRKSELRGLARHLGRNESRGRAPRSERSHFGALKAPELTQSGLIGNQSPPNLRERFAERPKRLVARRLDWSTRSELLNLRFGRNG